jgi:hypothetical protein
MPHSSSPDLLALHGLRLKGFAEATTVAELVGLDVVTVETELSKASNHEWAMFRDGRRTGWALKPAGRSENERLLAAELDEVGCRPIVQSAYERFLALNGTMLAVCTRWQVVDADSQTLNDHSDAAYDSAVIAELEVLDDQVQPICAELSEQLDRFSVYAPRFTTALEKLRLGELDWFTKPIMESYHTVWFELHEDLLATLGIDRASEKAHE